jgi:hypothetical protein
MYNTLNETLTARLSIVDFSDNALAVSLPTANTPLSLPGLSTTNQTMTVEATNFTLATPPPFLQVRGVATAPGEGRLQDAVLRDVRVVSPGAPQSQQQQGFIGPAKSPVKFTFTIPSTAVEGTITVSAQVYPSSFSALIEALKRIITEPVICTYCREGPAYWRSLALETFGSSDASGVSGLSLDLVNQARA